jgi:hypothetical protein
MFSSYSIKNCKIVFATRFDAHLSGKGKPSASGYLYTIPEQNYIILTDADIPATPSDSMQFDAELWKSFSQLYNTLTLNGPYF